MLADSCLIKSVILGTLSRGPTDTSYALFVVIRRQDGKTRSREGDRETRSRLLMSDWKDGKL